MLLCEELVHYCMILFRSVSNVIYILFFACPPAYQFNDRIYYNMHHLKRPFKDVILGLHICTDIIYMKYAAIFLSMLYRFARRANEFVVLELNFVWLLPLQPSQCICCDIHGGGWHARKACHLKPMTIMIDSRFQTICVCKMPILEYAS